MNAMLFLYIKITGDRYLKEKILTFFSVNLLGLELILLDAHGEGEFIVVQTLKMKIEGYY